MHICLTTREVKRNALVSSQEDSPRTRTECTDRDGWVAREKETKAESKQWIHQTCFFLLQVTELNYISKVPLKLGAAMWLSFGQWPGYRPTHLYPVDPPLPFSHPFVPFCKIQSSQWRDESEKIADSHYREILGPYLTIWNRTFSHLTSHQPTLNQDVSNR